MMRFIAVLFGSGLLLACSGVSGGGLDDGGTADSPHSILCNGTSCSGYCIHPSPVTCPTCVLAPDSGTCPPDSTMLTYCPAGPPMQGDGFCVHYPQPDPPFCSDTIPASCFPQGDTSSKPGDVTCMSSVCAS